MACTHRPAELDSLNKIHYSQLWSGTKPMNAARRVKAPRSSGCRTCVGRRVKCDRSHPVCQRCRKAGLECDGPPFVPQNTIETPESMALRVHSRPQRRFFHYSTLPKDQPSQRASTTSRSATIEANLSTEPMLEDVCRNFFLDRYWASSRPEGYHLANKEWMMDFYAHKNPDSSSLLALRSLSRSYFARIHQTERLQRQAMQLYSQALTALVSDLKDPSRALDFDTLAATALLEVYECVNFTSQAGWVQHCQGAGRLLQVRGPQRFHEPHEQAVFAWIRHFLVLEALQSKSRTFLEEQAWLNILSPVGVDIPWGVQLTSIFTRVPGLIEQVLALDSGSDVELIGADEKIELIRQDLDTVLQEFRRWHSDWQQVPRRLPIESQNPDSPRLFPSEVRPFAKDLNYNGLEFGTSTMYWNVYMIVTLRWMNKVESISSKLELLMASPTLDASNEIPYYQEQQRQYDLQPYAWVICRSIPYFLTSKHVYQGSHYITPPAHAALGTFPPESPIAKWLKKVLHLIARQNGFALAKGLLAR